MNRDKREPSSCSSGSVNLAAMIQPKPRVDSVVRQKLASKHEVDDPEAVKV